VKRFVTTLAMCLLTMTLKVHAENSFDLYADQAMTQCALVDQAPGLQQVHVFLTGTEMARHVVFTAPRPDCWQGASWVGDILPGPRGTVGNTQIGFGSTLYGNEMVQCKTPPVFVCSMLFVTSGASLPCCDYVVVPKPLPGEPYAPEYIDCTYGEQPAHVGRKVVINPNESCPCELPVKTEPTTWGRVKSLYR